MADWPGRPRSLTSSEPSHSVRIWATRKYKGARGTTYGVRWVVGGKESHRSFATAKLADGFRAQLLTATRDGIAFDANSGLPISLIQAPDEVTWFEHAMAYVRYKWPRVSARHRKGIAEALVPVTLALTFDAPERPDDVELRGALFHWALNASRNGDNIPVEHADAIAWLRRASLPLRGLTKPAVRGALDALSLTLEGLPAAPSTIARKRATFNNALEHAVERELLSANPLKGMRSTASKASDDRIDRRVVVNPTQARALLAAVWDHDPHLAAFFACLYYAGLRPSEARNLAIGACRLPDSGWGTLTLAGSHQTAGSSWTDTGTASEVRTLKHRGQGHTRSVPAHPELVACLQRHVDRFQLGVEGRLFVSRTGRAGVPIAPPYQNPVGMNAVYRAWAHARSTALTQEQFESPLARRPYDLRHACLSTWLNAGVSAAQVADWAGHSVQVLLRVYSKCLDGEEAVARQRIDAALAT
jgi:integrase